MKSYFYDKCMYEVLAVGLIAQVWFVCTVSAICFKFLKKQKFEFESVLED